MLQLSSDSHVLYSRPLYYEKRSDRQGKRTVHISRNRSESEQPQHVGEQHKEKYSRHIGSEHRSQFRPHYGFNHIVGLFHHKLGYHLFSLRYPLQPAGGPARQDPYYQRDDHSPYYGFRNKECSVAEYEYLFWPQMRKIMHIYSSFPLQRSSSSLSSASYISLTSGLTFLFVLKSGFTA